MPVERSAGTIVVRETTRGKEFLLLQHPDKENNRVSKSVAGHWDFPKGHIDPGETTEETIRREVGEETGITKLEFVPGFKHTIRYFVNYDGTKRLKFVVYFLASTRQKKITLSWEHQGFAWLPYEQAYERLTYQNAKQVLKSAYDFLSEKSL